MKAGVAFAFQSKNLSQGLAAMHGNAGSRLTGNGSLEDFQGLQGTRKPLSEAPMEILKLQVLQAPSTSGAAKLDEPRETHGPPSSVMITGILPKSGTGQARLALT